MGFDDGAADRQTDACARRLCRIARREHAVDVAGDGFETLTRVAYRDLHFVPGRLRRGDGDGARLLVDVLHGVDGVADEIHQKLRDLEAVAEYRRQVGR